MPLSALGLVLAAACLHALWNVLLARARDVQAATAVLLLVPAVLCAPLAAFVGHVTWSAAPWIAASSALELAYFVLLATAYTRSEVSLVYPIARGLAPMLVLVVAVLALGRGTTVGQAGGVCIVGLGVLLVRGLGKSTDRRGVLFGLAIACFVAGYTLVDKEGIQHASLIPYFELVLAGPAVAYAIGGAATRGISTIRAELTPLNAAVGLGGFAAYALVLAALRLAPAAPVAAARESSVVIATVLAAVILRERVTAGRLAGSLLVVGGVAALALS